MEKRIKKFRSLEKKFFISGLVLTIVGFLVAIIFLESSMLAEFGSNSEGERVLLLISGCSVALIILLLSVYISKHADK